MDLVVAEGVLLDRILDSTFSLWHEGLTRPAYGRWNAAQARTPWGRDRLQRLALVDAAGRWLATVKRYRFDITVDGREGWMSGIGALFAAPDHRGRGYASALVERIVEEDRRRGALVAGLFSEIGPAFYERLGFRPVPLDEVTVRIARREGAPAVLVRTGNEGDLPAVSAMHDARARGAGFSLRRDPALVHFALSKKRLLAGLGPPGLRQLEFVVAEEGARAVAYAVFLVTARGWTLEDAGDRDPAASRLGAILQVLAAREPSASPLLARAWWPKALPTPPQLELTDYSTPDDVLMLRPLADISLPGSAADVFYWHIDHF
jgi:GNAT superfamily N-acetyltransferase